MRGRINKICQAIECQGKEEERITVTSMFPVDAAAESRTNAHHLGLSHRVA